MAIEVEIINGKKELKNLKCLIKKLLQMRKVKDGIYKIELKTIQKNSKQERKLLFWGGIDECIVKIPLKGQVYIVDIKKPEDYDQHIWNVKIKFVIKHFNELLRKKYNISPFRKYLIDLCIKVKGRDFKPFELITEKEAKILEYKNKKSLFAVFYSSKNLRKIPDMPGYFEFTEDFLKEVKQVQKEKEAEMNKIKVEISVGNHSVVIPKGMKELLEDLLIVAKCKPRVYKARLGKFLKGSPHQQGKKGLKVKKYVDTGVYVVAQPGSNDTACEIIMLSPNGQNIKDWYYRLKLGAKRLKTAKKKDNQQKVFRDFMKKLCLTVNAQDFRPSQFVDEKDAKKYGYKNKASLVSTMYNAKKYVVKKKSKPGFFAWNKDFVKKLQSVIKPDLGFVNNDIVKSNEEQVNKKTSIDELEKQFSILSKKIEKNQEEKEILQKEKASLLKSKEYLQVEIQKMQKILKEKNKKLIKKDKLLQKINKKLDKDEVNFEQLQTQLKKREKELKLSKIFNELVTETGSKEKAIDRLLDLLDR